ncbi:MAG: hypothetical protein KAS23_17285 [Anaerohalosphaera sp.]|nr:hypothetical protein [Anaerohalosphaera sp.]
MNKCRDLFEVLEGRTPSITPYTILDWNMERAITSDDLAKRIKDDRWKRLLDMGLTIRHHSSPVKVIEHGVESAVEEKTEGNNLFRIETKSTPIGSIRRVSRNGWRQEDWGKTDSDYKVRQWIVENTELVADFDAVEKAEQVVGEHGFVALTGHGRWLHRTPMMTLNIDYLGTERFCMHLAMDKTELFDLCSAQEKLFLDEQRLIAAGPGRYVVLYENITVSMLGPARYADLMMPVYRKAVDIHEEANKRVMVHYDGALSLIADQISDAPFHIIDSLTEAPEGDMEYQRCRSLWPDKVILANINVDQYYQPAEILRQAVIDKRNRLGKNAVAFEISEDTQTNWQQTIPVVLGALQELD